MKMVNPKIWRKVKVKNHVAEVWKPQKLYKSGLNDFGHSSELKELARNVLLCDNAKKAEYL